MGSVANYSSDQASLTEFDRVWPFLEPAIGTPPTHTKEDVWRLIATGRATFWPLANSAIVGNVLTFPSGLRAGNLWLAGGDWNEIKEQMPMLEAHAKAIGCARADVYAIPKVARALYSYGYELRRMHVVKELP